MSPYRKFTLRLCGLLFVILSVTFWINFVVDPLWHFNGNRTSEVSYRFEERSMKLNGILKNPGHYDCVIFGASRTTLLDETLIEDASCYNLAFSLGHVREFRIVSEYLKARGFEPERVIIGIDEVSFQPRANTDGKRLPEYVQKGERPKLAIEDYLGVTTLRFSYETLFDPPTFIRGYVRRDDGTYVGVLLPHTRVYEPPVEAMVTEEHLQEYDANMLDEFRALRDVFPDAEFVGYVPPISDWSQAKIDLTGNLERYIEFRHAMVPLFDGGLWDFSVPSEITADTSLTFDGEHYEAPVNDIAGRCLNGEMEFCGADLRALTLEEYRALILPPVRDRIAREGLSVTLGGDEATAWADDA